MSNKNINIGNNNNIKKSSIGYFKGSRKKNSLTSKILKWVFGILATIIAGIILAWFSNLFNLN